MIRWDTPTMRKTSKLFLLVFGILLVGVDSLFGWNLLSRDVFVGITVKNIAGAMCLFVAYLIHRRWH